MKCNPTKRSVEMQFLSQSVLFRVLPGVNLRWVLLDGAGSRQKVRQVRGPHRRHRHDLRALDQKRRLRMVEGVGLRVMGEAVFVDVLAAGETRHAGGLERLVIAAAEEAE